jgi:hypothetical protein
VTTLFGLWCACGLAGLAVDYVWNADEWAVDEQPLLTLLAIGLCVLIGPIGLILAIVVHHRERVR